MLGLNRALWLLFALNFAIGFTNQFIRPLFPLYLQNLSASEMEIGLVLSLSSVAATAFMMPSGLLIDRVGRKRMLLLSVILSVIPTALIAYAEDWRTITPFFIVFNVAFAFFIPARMAIIADSATPQNRATMFGLMNMAWPISGIIAPALSGYVVENYGWTLLFLFSAAILAMSFLPTLLIKETERILDKSIEKAEKGSIFDRDRLPFIIAIFFFHLAMTTGQGGVNTILPIYLKNQKGLSALLIGFFFTGSSLLTLLTQIPSGRLADRFSRKKLVIACIAPIPVLYGVWGLIDNWIILLIFNSLAFGLWSMTWPATLALLSDSVPPSLIGSAFGVRMTGTRLGFTIGPLIAGYLYTTISSSAPFVASALFFFLGMCLALMLKETYRDLRLADEFSPQ